MNLQMMKGDENEVLDIIPALMKCPNDEDGQTYRALTYSNYCLKKLCSFYHHSLLADVILVVENYRIPAHRIVLASASEYFFAMFNNKLREANELEVSMRGVDGQSIKTLVEFFYSGEIIIHEDMVENLLRTACMLQLSNVVNACTEFLKFRLHPSNCIGLRNFAEEQSCSNLQESAEKFIMDNFTDVVRYQEFLELPIDDVEKLLSSNDINVLSEEMVYETMNSWISYRPLERDLFTSRLLSLIKLPLLSPEFIADRIVSSPLFGKCYDLVLEALNYHLLPERRAMLQSPRTRPRNSTVGTLVMVGGMDGYKGSLQMDQYDLRTNTWSQFGNMSGRRLQFGAAVIDNKIYVVGGRDGLKTLNTVECFDPDTKTWKPMPSMTNHRHGLGVTVLEGPMYAVGGHDGWSYLSTVERWDPSNLQWSYVAPMNTQRCTVGVASLNNKLYAVGGRDGSSCLKSVECFDPHTNKWSHCPPMAKRRGGPGIGVINGYLFAVGGHDAPILNSSMFRYECVERFDPQTSTWTMVAPMSIGRDSIGVCVLGDKIIAVAGYDGQSYLQIVEAYDPQENKWQEIQRLSNGRAGMSVLVLKKHRLKFGRQLV